MERQQIMIRDGAREMAPSLTEICAFRLGQERSMTCRVLGYFVVLHLNKYEMSRYIRLEGGDR